MIVALIVISQSGGDGGIVEARPRTSPGVAQVDAELKGIPQSGQVLGDSAAPVTVIEYGDPQCSSCKFFSESVAPDLISSEVRPGNVKYEFRPVPDHRTRLEAGDEGGARGRESRTASGSSCSSST